MSGPNNNAIVEKCNWLLKVLKNLNKKIEKCCAEPESEPVYTAFNISTNTDNGCIASSGPALDQTIYHDGVLAYPQVGDTVYLDAAGTTPLVSPDVNTHWYLGDLTNNGYIDAANWLYTDINGVRILIPCK